MGAGDTELSTLHEELATIARKIARLLILPNPDAAELAALDKEAKQLRARIREAEEQAADREMVLLPGTHGTWLN
jgi:hypothetical protein